MHSTPPARRRFNRESVKAFGERISHSIEHLGWLKWFAAALLIIAAVFMALQTPDCQGPNMPQNEIMWCASHASKHVRNRFREAYIGTRVIWRGKLDTEQQENPAHNHKPGDHITALITGYGA